MTAPSTAMDLCRHNHKLVLDDAFSHYPDLVWFLSGTSMSVFSVDKGGKVTYFHSDAAKLPCPDCLTGDSPVATKRARR